jgi:hypothetical protein
MCISRKQTLKLPLNNLEINIIYKIKKCVTGVENRNLRAIITKKPAKSMAQDQGPNK